ncbi:hypothetical protein GCM10023231_34040 [Olivibacter ginsenosidimutans]|uniref:Response regulator transcription factor n=2 Tax=Olivibacter ginsenosidimutans TaxID=1176537 RepID=A0ABP9C150_9SPHI
MLVEDDDASIDMIAGTMQRFFPEIRLLIGRNLDEARHLFAINQPELLLLDINLPDGLSLDWLREIFDNNRQLSIIFTTAHANYAVEAFKFSALDYLLKPFVPQELIQAVQKALQVIGDRDLHVQLETFFHNYQQQQTPDKRLVLRTTEEIRVVNILDMLVIEADNSYSKCYLKGAEGIWVTQSIKTFDHQLSGIGFMRVHQSYLVHLRYIVSFKKKTNLLVLVEGLSIPVSQQKRASLLAYLNNLDQ